MKSMMDSCVQVYWRRITREHFPSGYLGGKITCRISFCRRVIYSIRILLLYLSIHIQYSTIWSLLPVGITTAVPFKSDPHAETRPRLSVAALRSPPTSMTPCPTTLAWLGLALIWSHHPPPGELSKVPNTSRNPHSTWLEMGPVPKRNGKRALGAPRDIWAASGRPFGVFTVPHSRRGRDGDVILAHN